MNDPDSSASCWEEGCGRPAAPANARCSLHTLRHGPLPPSTARPKRVRSGGSSDPTRLKPLPRKGVSDWKPFLIILIVVGTATVVIASVFGENLLALVRPGSSGMMGGATFRRLTPTPPPPRRGPSSPVDPP